MNFGMIVLNQSISVKQNCVTKILKSFVIHIKTEDFYEDIANDVEKWFDTSNYDENDKRPLPGGQNNKVIGLFKDELGGMIMKKFVRLRTKAYAYLMDNDSEHKKSKRNKEVCNKKKTYV